MLTIFTDVPEAPRIELGKWIDGTQMAVLRKEVAGQTLGITVNVPEDYTTEYIDEHFDELWDEYYFAAMGIPLQLVQAQTDATLCDIYEALLGGAE